MLGGPRELVYSFFPKVQFHEYNIYRKTNEAEKSTNEGKFGSSVLTITGRNSFDGEEPGDFVMVKRDQPAEIKG